MADFEAHVEKMDIEEHVTDNQDLLSAEIQEDESELSSSSEAELEEAEHRLLLVTVGEVEPLEEVADCRRVLRPREGEPRAPVSLPPDNSSVARCPRSFPSPPPRQGGPERGGRAGASAKGG